MLNISKIQGLYRNVNDEGSVIVANQRFLDGPTMSELYLMQCADLQGSQPQVVQHCGIDRGFGDHASGIVVQKYGTNGWNETRTKILSIRDLSFHDGFLHIIVNVLEYKHPHYTKNTLSPTADRHILFESKYDFLIERCGDGELLALYLSIKNRQDGTTRNYKYYQYDNSGDYISHSCDRLPSSNGIQYGKLHIYETHPHLIIKVRKYEKESESNVKSVVNDILSEVIQRDENKEYDKLLIQDSDIFSNILF